VNGPLLTFSILSTTAVQLSQSRHSGEAVQVSDSRLLTKFFHQDVFFSSAIKFTFQLCIKEITKDIALPAYIPVLRSVQSTLCNIASLSRDG
jgi:hypothetical protein